MKRGKLLLRIALPYLLIAVISIHCGGGGGGGVSSNNTTPTPTPTPTLTGLTTFSGGTLADLKALSPNLAFDQLEITGNLDLPHNSSTTITANKLTVTSSGGIGYSYDNCTYVAAPHLTLTVSGDVEIDGNIHLAGRYGKTVYSLNPSCDSPYGQDGGNVTITGDAIKITGEVSNSGGDGALLSSGTYGGVHCSSGDSGGLTLAAATTMDLSGAKISNRAGVGLDASKNGSSGTVNISAGESFIMRNGYIDSTGPMTFSSTSTDIWGSIHYGSLNETIGGAKDTASPTISLVSQLSNTTLTYHKDVQVKVEASDVGMGLRGIKIVGLGNTKTFDIVDCKNGVGSCTLLALDSTITVSLPVNDSTSLQTLQVTAIDNKGYTTDAPLVTGITVQLPPETEPNDSFEQAQTLEQGGIIVGTVQDGDPGMVWTSPLSFMLANAAGVYKVEDFYKIRCCSTWYETNILGDGYYHYGISLTVDFSGSASVTPDIDVYLFDQGSVVSWSQVDNVGLNNYVENIQLSFDSYLVYNASSGNYYVPPASTSIGKTFYVGIQAWKVPTRANYIIHYK